MIGAGRRASRAVALVHFGGALHIPFNHHFKIGPFASRSPRPKFRGSRGIILRPVCYSGTRVTDTGTIR
ncbi:protein of unknown function [Paraburkholderia kururiensis]